MTTPLEYLASNPSIEDTRNHWLLFSKDLRDSVLEKQATLTTNHRISPVLLTDGRYGVCCDLLTAIGEGQIYHDIFALLDMEALDEAELVDTATFKALLPEPTEEI